MSLYPRPVSDTKLIQRYHGECTWCRYLCIIWTKNNVREQETDSGHCANCYESKKRLNWKLFESDNA